MSNFDFLDVFALQVLANVVPAEERETPVGVEKAYAIANLMMKEREKFIVTQSTVDGGD